MYMFSMYNTDTRFTIICYSAVCLVMYMFSMYNTDTICIVITYVLLCTCLMCIILIQDVRMSCYVHV